jgi:hypothetical protein
MQRNIKNRNDLNSLVAQFQARGGVVTVSAKSKTVSLRVSKSTRAVVDAIRKERDAQRALRDIISA